MSGEIQSDGQKQNERFDPDSYQTVNIPSAQLTPDEYLHDDNKLGLVIIFYSKDDIENAKTIRQNLLEQKYVVSDNNFVPLSNRQSVLQYINNIASENHTDKTCLILIMMGNSEYEGEILPDNELNSKTGALKIKEVFTPFSGNRCYSFRNKPKIFIFQSSMSISTVRADSMTFSPVAPPQALQVPTEADILLVCKHVSDATKRHLFIDGFCMNIHNFGQMDDILGLVTHTNYDDHKRPLIISTLTKQFYMSSSKERRHNYHFYKTQENMLNVSQNLAGKIKKLKQLTNNSQATTNNHLKSPVPDTVDSRKINNRNSIASTSKSSIANENMKKKSQKKIKPPWR